MFCSGNKLLLRCRPTSTNSRPRNSGFPGGHPRAARAHRRQDFQQRRPGELAGALPQLGWEPYVAWRLEPGFGWERLQLASGSVRTARNCSIGLDRAWNKWLILAITIADDRWPAGRCWVNWRRAMNYTTSRPRQTATGGNDTPLLSKTELQRIGTLSRSTLQKLQPSSLVCACLI